MRMLITDRANQWGLSTRTEGMGATKGTKNTKRKFDKRGALYLGVLVV